MSEDGITLGRHYDDATGRVGDKIIYTGGLHTLIVGPNGCGKGSRVLANHLLSSVGTSILVIDPKGELCAISKDYRATLGDVAIINPFNVLGLGSTGFEPLRQIDPKAPTFYDDAAGQGEAAIRTDSKEPHWTESAQGLTVGLMMWEKQQNRATANLENVRRMLTEADEFETYEGEDGKTRRKQTKGLRITATNMVAEGGYEIASLAGRFLNETNEIASIRSTADTQTRWLLSRPMRDDLKKPGFDFRHLKQKPTTVYVILPAERIRTHATWLRLVIVSALRALYRPRGVKVTMIIDEMPALGHLGPLEDAFGLIRGYGLQIVGVCQDLTQLKAIYRERWESMIANAGAVMCFAPNDLTTAKWMSERAGVTTVVASNFGENRSPHGGRPSESTNWHEIGRPLYLPHELMGMPQGTGLLFLAGMANAVRFFAPPYWKIASCAARAGKNPYVEDTEDAD
jgi:type IV secretion system protein VirD4